ncbi:MAG: 2-oxo acid dehydrogenase subunit E2 [Deltaproteobacteria bacterium]
MSTGEVALARERHGRNELPRDRGTPAWRTFLRQLTSPLVLLMIAATAVSVALGEHLDAIAIATVVVLNAVLGFVQDDRAEHAIFALRTVTSPRARAAQAGSARRVLSPMTMHGKRLQGWRRVAAAMWHDADDPQIFGRLELDARPVRRVIDEGRRAGVHVTATHVVGCAVAHALDKVPELNVQIRHGRAYPRPTIDVFFIAAVANGDLSGIKLVDVPHKSVTDVARALGERATAIKEGRDAALGRSKWMMDAIPAPLLRPALRASAYLTQRLRVDLPRFGLPRSPFGSAMISSVGMFGLPEGFAPLAWMYDVPLLVLVGELAQRAVVENGQVVAREVLPITATIDHRYVDGWHLARTFDAFREYLGTPIRSATRLGA